MNDNHKAQLPVVLSFLDDARRIIEGGKVRRWQVFQWTVALNILLTTAAFARDKPPIAPIALPLISLIVSVAAVLLIVHYDHRLTEARKRALKLADWLRIHIMDIYAPMGQTTLIPPEEKDTVERTFFYVGIAASVMAVLIAVGPAR